MGSLAELVAGKRVLLAVAARIEATAIGAAFGRKELPPLWQLSELDSRFDLVRTGVSKAAAAGGVARVLDPARHGLVLSVGIAGALGTASTLGQVVFADRCELVDDGVQTPEGFESLERLGFGPFNGEASEVEVSRAVIDAFSPLAGVIGPVATVSVCSGTNAAAANLAGQGFVAEAMEGAAVALVGERVGVPFGELRVISNTTGDRAAQRWELTAALSGLTSVLGRMRAL